MDQLLLNLMFELGARRWLKPLVYHHVINKRNSFSNQPNQYYSNLIIHKNDFRHEYLLDVLLIMATMAYTKDSASSSTGPARKKVKTSDLPLASATRGAIDNLAHLFKKKGGYDSLRKQIWEDLEKSVGFSFP